MNKNLEEFLKEFQDAYITKIPTVDKFDDTLTTVELAIIDKHLGKIEQDLDYLSSLIKNASIEAKSVYKEAITILEDKIDYIEEVSNIYLGLNHYYDLNTLSSVKSYNLKECLGNFGVTYNNEVRGITLEAEAINYVPAKSINGNVVTFNNTNSSIHTGIVLKSAILDSLDLKEVQIYKADGTVLTYYINEINSTSYYIMHEAIESIKVEVHFNDNVGLSSIKLSLINNRYSQEGSIGLQTELYESGSYLTMLYDVSLYSNTYANLNLHIKALDINSNVISIDEVLIPVSSSVICKRLDNIDWQSVEEVFGIYVNNMYTEDPKHTNREYLKNLDKRIEVFVIFKSKLVKLNNNYTIVNNNTVKINNKNIKYLDVTPSLELFSFDKNNSPLVKMVSGVIKI